MGIFTNPFFFPRFYNIHDSKVETCKEFFPRDNKENVKVVENKRDLHSFMILILLINFQCPNRSKI